MPLTPENEQTILTWVKNNPNVTPETFNKRVNKWKQRYQVDFKTIGKVLLKCVVTGAAANYIKQGGAVPEIPNINVAKINQAKTPEETKP